MTDHIIALFAPLLHDGRFWWLAATVTLAGLVRGFSGFGTAMIFMPVASALFEPKIAVVQMFIFDVLVTLPLVIASFSRCAWRQMVPLVAGAAVMVPVGVGLLVWIDPEPVRWIMSTAILAAIAAMIAGWRYRRQPGLAMTVGVGGLSGMASGMAGLSGPPVILFWLGGQSAAAAVRWNVIAFLGLISVISGGVFFAHGLFTAEVVAGGLALMPFYGAAMVLGAMGFGRSSERQYRVIALGLCAAVTLAALPLWQQF